MFGRVLRTITPLGLGVAVWALILRRLAFEHVLSHSDVQLLFTLCEECELCELHALRNSQERGYLWCYAPHPRCQVATRVAGDQRTVGRCEARGKSNSSKKGEASKAETKDVSTNPPTKETSSTVGLHWC